MRKVPLMLFNTTSRRRNDYERYLSDFAAPLRQETLDKWGSVYGFPYGNGGCGLNVNKILFRFRRFKKKNVYYSRTLYWPAFQHNKSKTLYCSWFQTISLIFFCFLILLGIAAMLVPPAL